MLLSLKNISKSYSSNATEHRQVLSDINLEIKEGYRVAIVGPSGSGKTTLLNIIGTLDKPDQGQVLYREEDISQLDNQQLASFRSQVIGFVFQHHYLLPQCTLWENILIPTLPIRDRALKNQSTDRGKELLKRTGIWAQRHQKPGELSGGECQRAAVVRALVNSPTILLADEPTGALDQRNSEMLAEILFEFNQSDKITLIMVTHDMSLAAKADEIYILKDGNLALQN